MPQPLIRPLAAAVALAAAATAFADDAPLVSFSGYGTLGAVHSDNGRADYLVDAFKPNGPGHSRAWSADVDSRLGAQASMNVTPRLSGVVQVLVQQQYDNSYRPRVEWANLKYQVTEDFAVRAGRVVLPVFMVTDSRLVNYANPWVRPPVEVYSLVPVTSNDGADAIWRAPLRGMTNTLQLTVGGSDSKFPNASGFEAGTAKARRLVTVVDTVEHGALQLRLNYGQADLTIAALAPLFDVFRQFGPAGAAIADRYDLQGKRVHFVGFGASYDPGPWFAMAEWARFDTRSIVGKKTAWYASAGARFGKLTPYLTYARIRSEGPTSDPGVPLAGLPPPLAATAAALNAALNQQLSLVPRQRTVSAGVRWDVLRSMAIKAQIDEVRPDEGSPGTFGHVQPGFIGSGAVRVFSVAADFVF